MSKRQHRWKKWPPPDVTKTLEANVKHLKWAWSLDKQSPKVFPMNTWWIFVQLEDRLKDDGGPKTKAKLPTLPLPTSFADLIPERTLKAAYEDHYEGSFADALKLARKGFGDGYRAWRKIKHALEIAYLICHQGLDMAPMP